jgi:superfamily II DNA/RNA helicase
MRKLALLTYFLYRIGNVSLKGKKVIVFVRTKERGERVAEYLQEHKFRACYVHSDSLPGKRRAFLEEFRNGHINVSCLL